MSTACPDYLHLQKTIRLLLHLKRKTLHIVGKLLKAFMLKYFMPALFGYNALSLILGILCDVKVVINQFYSVHLFFQHY